MTWDENLLQFQKKYGGSLLGSIYPYQPAGLLHTRFRGAELTFYPSMVSSGNAAPTLWAAAAVPAELVRPFSLSVKHRNKLIPQGLLADLELCSTGRTELDGVLFTESDDPEFAKKVFLSSELSDLLTRQKRYQFHIRPVVGSNTLHVVQARTDWLRVLDGQLTGPGILSAPPDEERLLAVLEHLASLAAAGLDAVTRWPM